MKRVTGKIFTLILSFLVVFSLVPASGIAFATDGDAAAGHEEGFANEGDALEGVSDEAADAAGGGETSLAAGDDEDADASGALEALASVLDDEEDAGEALEALAAYTWNTATPPTVVDGDTVTISGTPSGTLSVPAGATITIDGSITGATAGLTLNIGAGATVNWEATLQGTLTGIYLITVTGSGALALASCSLINSGSGGAISITGAGSTITVGDGAVASSDMGGNGILVNAAGATINVNAGGTVSSLASNANAAIQVNNNIMNTIINVNGGTVSSTATGYAINDGAGTATYSNNTTVNVNSGLVSAMQAAAIHSTGSATTVTVNGGTVTNAANNNLNPAIFMNAGSGDNVFILGGTVQSTSNPGYALQTTGNVIINGGTVTAINGRAINLVGLTSTATVVSGIVQTMGTGTAISTATSGANVADNVANTSIIVSGGLVSSALGTAINMVGTNSAVSISGGQVITSATTTNATNPNHTVMVSGDNSSVTVSGGSVSSTVSNTINATGANSQVTFTGGQTSATTGRAVNLTGAGSLASFNGGFVFAYGSTSLADVITAVTISPANLTGSATAVVTWNHVSSSFPYGASNAQWAISGLIIRSPGTVQWQYDPALGAGLNYVNGPYGTGFFPIANVEITRDAGLYFDASLPDGEQLYYLSGATHVPAPGHIDNWSAVGSTLTLDNFRWYTALTPALTVITAGTIIELADGSINTFSSSAASGASIGISSPDSVTIQGGGVLIARGNTGAFDVAPTLPVSYTWWSSKTNADPGGAGTRYFAGPPVVGASYVSESDDLFVRIAAAAFATVSDQTVSGIMDSPLSPQQAVISIFATDMDLLALSAGDDVSNWFVNCLPAGVTVAVSVVFENTITVEFSGTPLEGSTSQFNILIPLAPSSTDSYIVLSSMSALSVIDNPSAKFDIEAVYDLFVVVGTGGSGAGTTTGRYPAGSLLSFTATADAGYHFTGWTVTGTTLAGGALTNPAVINMPTNRVVLTANFAPDAVPPGPDPDPNPDPDSDQNNGAGTGTGSGTGSGLAGTADGALATWIIVLSLLALSTLSILGLRRWRKQ
ncbi:MAG: hypothetical protein FWE41_00810 [Coriobacteriia bacterium]|nr:hypothetical protein [Coriobacteriia bacterium]MCL2750522.1 hypothetical protein [Coriobacteriia bacterium]